jgi:hypothetical protein
LDLKFVKERTKLMKNVWDVPENFLKEISLPAVVLRIYFSTSQIKVRYNGTRILSTTDISY